MSKARALPPRQSFSNIVRALERKPALLLSKPAFKLLTTAPRCVNTRLMPIACLRRTSSLASSAAMTFFKLSEPARSTRTSFPRRTRGSGGPDDEDEPGVGPSAPAAARSAALSAAAMRSTVTMKRQWDLEERRFLVVSRTWHLRRPASSTSQSSHGDAMGTFVSPSQEKARGLSGSCRTSSRGAAPVTLAPGPGLSSASERRSTSNSRLPSEGQISRKDASTEKTSPNSALSRTNSNSRRAARWAIPICCSSALPGLPSPSSGIGVGVGAARRPS
mmetsp:Transcript_82894/g.208904  ORF Transcript_82894/g.208904 Transcript_82894/m.208904 type:complete len:276 (+) Transcript_82894:1301-2128(+)